MQQLFVDATIIRFWACRGCLLVAVKSRMSAQAAGLGTRCHSLACPFAHLLTLTALAHSPTQQITQSHTHALTHFPSLTHPTMHLLIHSFTFPSNNILMHASCNRRLLHSASCGQHIVAINNPTALTCELLSFLCASDKPRHALLCLNQLCCIVSTACAHALCFG